MPVYSVYGRRLGSDIPLPELATVGGESDFLFRRGALAIGAERWFEIWPQPDGRPWIRGMKVSCGYRVRYEDRGDFLLDVDTRSITFDDALCVCPAEMMRHFLLDQVVPLMLSLDAPVLHASSVVIAGEMTAFIGPGGAGKSTIAVALARRGHALGSDDGLLLRREGDRWLGVPAYAGARLWPDSAAVVAAGELTTADGAAARKLRVRDGLPFASGPFPLTRLYVIDPSPAISIRFEPLTARAALMELVQQTYRLALDDRDALASQFDVLADVVTRLSAWRVSFPRTLAGVSGLAESVGEHIGDTARAASAKATARAASAKASASPASAKATARQA
jgi:hypothetical protein